MANPVAGFVLLVAVPGVTGAALLHPPKSSSALTFGGPEFDGLNPPPPPGTMLWLAKEPPEAHPNAFELVCGDNVGLGIGGLTLAGPEDGVLHASLDPQASVLFQPVEAAADGLVCVCGGRGCGDDRLNTDGF